MRQYGFVQRGEQLNALREKCKKALTKWIEQPKDIDSPKVESYPEDVNERILKQGENQTFYLKEDNCEADSKKTMRTQYHTTDTECCEHICKMYDHTKNEIIEKNKSSKKLEEGELSELRNQLQQALARRNEIEVKLHEANSENEVRHCMWVEFERKVREHKKHSEHLKDVNNKLLTSETDLQNTLTKLRKIEVEFEETKAEEMRYKQHTERKVSEYEIRIKDLEEANGKLLKIKDNLEIMIEWRDERITVLGKILQDNKHEADKFRENLKENENKLTAMRNQQHLTLEKLKETKAKLGKTMTEKEFEMRKARQSEIKAGEYKTRMKQSKDNNEEMMESQKQRIYQLERIVEGKVREVKALEKSLSSIKHDISDKDQLRKNLKETEDKSGLELKLQNVLTKLKKRDNELEETRRRQNEYFKRTEKEIKAKEYLTLYLEKENDKNCTVQKQKVKTLEEATDVNDNRIRYLEKYKENAKKDIDQLRQKLNTSIGQLSELRHQHQQIVVQLNETEAKLDEERREKELERQQKQDLERKTSILESCMIQFEDANEQECTSYKHRIQHFENEAKHTDCKIRDLESLIETYKYEIGQKNEQENDLKETIRQLSEVRNQQQKKEIQKGASEYEDIIEKLEKENLTTLASHKQIKQNLENELDRRGNHIKDLEKYLDNSKKDIDNQKKEHSKTVGLLSELNHQHQLIVVKLSETEAKLDEEGQEKELERQQRQDLKRQTSMLESRIRHFEEANEQESTSYKHRIQHFENEAKNKDCKIRDLKASIETYKYEVGQKNKQENDLKETIRQLSEVRNQQQKKEIEKGASEYEDIIEKLEKENLTTLASHKQITQNLENELDRRGNRIKDLEKYLDNSKKDIDNQKKEHSKTVGLLSELNHQQQLIVVKLSETEVKLDEEGREKELEWKQRQNLKRQTSMLESRIRHFEEANEQESTSYKQRIQHFENEAKNKDCKIRDLEASIETYKYEVGQKNEQENDLKETIRQLSEVRNQQQLCEKREIEKGASEYEDIIEKLEKENLTTLASHKQITQNLENELDRRGNHIKDLEIYLDNFKKDIDKQGKELSKTFGQLSELRDQNQQIVVQLNETEAKLDEERREKEFERHQRQDLERKTCMFESRIRHFEEAKEQESTDYKQRIQHFENEAELKERKIRDLEASVDNYKYEVSQKGHLEKDLKKTREQLSELSNQQQQMLAKLNETEVELIKTVSEKDVEKRSRQVCENKAKEFENSFKRSASENDEMLKSKNQRINQLEREVEGKEREVKALKDTLENIDYDISDSNRLRKNLKDSEDQLSALKSQLQNVLTKLKKTDIELERKVDEYENLVKHFEETNERTGREIKNLNESLENAKLAVSDKNQLLKNLKETKDQLSALKHQQKETLEKLKTTEADLKETTGKNVKKTTDALTDVKDKLQQALKKLKETEAELDETKTRLSKAMGDKLTDNNPNIADLSDKNRPVKLAERYAELYDNQWTDAFDILEKQFDREQDTIEALLAILLDTMHFCEANANKQLEDLQRVLGCTSIMENFPTDVRKNLKDCRKKMSSTTVGNLYKMYLAHLKTSASRSHCAAEETSSFVKECLEICWLMAIQDPPVVFAQEAKQGSKLNTDIYKFYTSSGAHVEYTVWPALLLHEGGPVLAKGVAQGYGKKSKTTKLTRQERT